MSRDGDGDAGRIILRDGMANANRLGYVQQSRQGYFAVTVKLRQSLGT